ncbi:MAG: hypothetical protein GXP31_06910 [Kiritimatiellaeota bacterium]|nr:hypothetical protein [Kiritimatiellota bacterium]
MFKRASITLVVFLVAATTGLAATGKEQGLLLYLSFDGTITADFARGKASGYQKRPGGSIAYVRGVKGKAATPTRNSVCWSARGNFRPSAGTVMFWAKPVEWDPSRPSKVWRTFFDAHQRGGRGGEDKIAFWRYPENMSGGRYNYHSAQGNNLDSLLLSIKDWRKGQWKFFALTWEEAGTAKVFVDGKLVSKRTRKRDALPVNINELAVGASGTAYDELRVFDRPLSERDIRTYFDAGRAHAAAPAGAEPTVASGATPSQFPNGPPTMCASPMRGAIHVDGIIDEPAWATCVEVRGLSRFASQGRPANRTSFRVGFTSKAIYIAVECVSRAARPKVTVREHGGPVYKDDSVELFIAPKADDKEYYQFVTNAVGARYEGRGMDGHWNGDWQVATTQGHGKWTMEIAIPFATLGVEASPGRVLGFNVCRNDKSANQSQTWADLGGQTFHRPDRFGRLVLGRRPIGAAGVTSVFRSDNRVSVRATIRNAGPAAANVRWLLAGSAAGRPFRFEERTRLGPQAVKTVEKTARATATRGRVAWRCALWVDGELLYLSRPRTADFLDLDPLVRARVPLVLANEKVRLAFDAHTGAVISLKDLETGQELRPRGEPEPLFSLDAVSFQKHPMFFREEDVMSLEASAQTARVCKVERRADGTQVLSVVHAFREGVTVRAAVELPRDSQISKWKIRVENRLPKRPREAVIVHRVAFPQLGGLRASESDKTQTLAWPEHTGFLIREPARKTTKAKRIESPGGASMSWLDLSGPKGGLYLASHDVKPAYQTILESKGDPKSGEVSLTVRRWSLLWPQKVWQPAACSVGLHGGDWHWSADRYREWFYSSVPVRPTPQWVRDEDAWMMDGGGPNRATFADIAHVLTKAQNMGSNYVQSWQHHMATEHGEMNAGQMPNVYGGTEDEFRGAIRNVHKRGGHIGFYFHGTDLETRLGGMLNQPKYRQKFPPDVVRRLPRPDPLSDGWLAAAVMSPAGAYVMGWPTGIDTWRGCLGSNVWSDWCYYWIVEKYAREYKSDAWYQDGSPWLGNGVCFHPNHGHDGPLPLGQANIDFGNRVVKGVSSDFAILSESVCDRFMNFQTHSLWAAGLGKEDSEPALFIYTHPRFPLFCGTVLYFGGSPGLGKSFFRGRIEKPSFADVLRYSLLYGGRFDLFGGPIRDGAEYLTPAVKAERDIVMLRRSVHDDFEQCAFKDRIGLSGIPDGVEARVFVRGDRKGALITVLDFRSERPAFTFSFDAAAHNLGRPVRAELRLPGGRAKPLATPSQDGAAVTFSLPANGAKISLVRLRTRR